GNLAKETLTSYLGVRTHRHEPGIDRDLAGFGTAHVVQERGGHVRVLGAGGDRVRYRRTGGHRRLIRVAVREDEEACIVFHFVLDGGGAPVPGDKEGGLTGGEGSQGVGVGRGVGTRGDVALVHPASEC